MRTKENQGKHDKGVAFWANQLINKGWSIVYSDLIDNTKPPQIGNYIPDVFGKHGIQEVIIEVETSDSVDLDHTKLQLSVFQVWKNQSANRIFMVKVV